MTDIFVKIVDLGIDAGFLILAVMAARLLLSKAPKSAVCLLWALVAVRLVTPFQVQSSFSLVPDVTELASAVSERLETAETGTDSAADGLAVQNTDGTAADNGEQSTARRAQETQNGQNAQAGQQAAETDAAALVESGNSGTAAENAGQTDADTNVNKLLQLCTAVWLAGVAAMLCYLFATAILLRRRAAARMRLHGNVYACDEVQSPFILGIFRPIVCLPSGMEDETVECVLRHERAHIRRRDQLWKPLGFLILSVYWFCPLCWAAYILFCRDLEFACDERAVRNMDGAGRAGYCQALLDCSRSRRLLGVCPVAFGEISVKKRIRAVADYKKPSFWAIMAAAAVCGVVAFCFFTSPREESTEENTVVAENNADAESAADITDTTNAGNTPETEPQSAAAAEGSAAETGVELSFEDLIAMVNSEDWNNFVAGTDADYWRGFANFTEETENIDIYDWIVAEYEYGERPYKVQVSCVPDGSETTAEFLLPGGAVDSIYLMETDTTDSILLYRSDKTNFQPDIDSFLSQSYDIFENITMDQIVIPGAPANATLGLKDYTVDLFLGFDGCLFDFDSGIAHGDWASEAWYSAGGIAEMKSGKNSEAAEYDDEEFVYDADGKLSQVAILDNHMEYAYVESFETEDFTGLLYEYNFDLYTILEMEEAGLDDTAQTTSEFWTIFLDSGVDEPTYVVFFNEKCFSKEQAVAAAQTVKKR